MALEITPRTTIGQMTDRLDELALLMKTQQDADDSVWIAWSDEHTSLRQRLGAIGDMD